MQKNILEYIISEEKEISKIPFDLVPGDRIFFIGDLGVGKSTFIRYHLRKYMNHESLVVRSPTYTYYQKYGQVYHFDLYRLEDYSTWVSLGGEEIMEDTNNILLIEWPEIISSRIIPTKTVSIEIMDDGNRKITLVVMNGSA